jgi:hypothetical protein
MINLVLTPCSIDAAPSYDKTSAAAAAAVLATDDCFVALSALSAYSIHKDFHVVHGIIIVSWL